MEYEIGYCWHVMTLSNKPTPSREIGNTVKCYVALFLCIIASTTPTACEVIDHQRPSMARRGKVCRFTSRVFVFRALSSVDTTVIRLIITSCKSDSATRESRWILVL